MGPVGCGMPPEGSRLTAKALGAVPGGRATIQWSGRPTAGLKTPALMGLPFTGNKPQLVALVRRGGRERAVIHEHAGFRIIGNVRATRRHTRLLRERYGDGVARREQIGYLPRFVKLLLLQTHGGVKRIELMAQMAVFVPQENRGDGESGADRDEHGGPPAAEESAGALAPGAFRGSPSRVGPFRSLPLRSGSFGIAANLAHQPLFYGGGRRNWRRGEGEKRDAPLRFGELTRALAAAGEVRLDGLLLFAFECAEGVEIEIFFASWMAVHAVHIPDATEVCSVRRKVSSAERRRVFTVPSGSPVRAAISECVSPSK